MSSFGGVPLDVHELGIDFLISSANKCIQAFRDLASSSLAVPSCCTARASPSHSLSTFTTNGKPWRKDMANGVLLLPHTWSAPSSKPWTNWQRRAVWRPVTTDIARTTACWWTHAFPRFPNVAAGRDSIARYYFFPLSSCRFQFQSFLHTTERAWICHLSGKDFASRHFPYRQYRRCSSRRFLAADRDNSRV